MQRREAKALTSFTKPAGVGIRVKRACLKIAHWMCVGAVYTKANALKPSFQEVRRFLPL